MSVLVKGMEMPKNCDKCKFSWWDVGHLYCEADGKPWGLEVTEYANKRHPDCPIVEIPPHGRLIDADLFSKVLKGRAAEEWNQHTVPFSWSYAYECLIDTVGLIPTVIPADKDGGDV